MASLQTRLKQIPANAGFYISVSSVRTSFVANTGTDSAPTFVNGPLISTMSSAGAYVSSVVNGAGAIFRDMGKSLVSSGRAFRKVQLMVSTGQLLVSGSAAGAGTDGVAGQDVAPTNYITGYLELPSFGTVGGNSGQCAAVARLG